MVHLSQIHNHYSNLLWDQDLNLLGVIDSSWEWSHVVLLQLLTPPVWLENVTVPSLALYQGDFAREVGYLLEAIRSAEIARCGTSTLSREWDEMQKRCQMLVVSALFSPDDIVTRVLGLS